QIYRRQMKYDLARQYLQKAAKAFPDSQEVQLNLVFVDRDQGLLEDALKRANDVLKKSERSNGRYAEGEKQNRRIFLMHQGLLNSTLGNYNEAIRSFNNLKALTTENDGRADALIIEVHRMAKDTDKALAQCELAMKELPSSRQLQILHADLVA